MLKATAISCRASDAYKQALDALAKSKKQKMADLVRHALDSVYGDELQPYLSFFADGDYKNSQMSTEKDGVTELA